MSRNQIGQPPEFLQNNGCSLSKAKGTSNASSKKLPTAPTMSRCAATEDRFWHEGVLKRKRLPLQKKLAHSVSQFSLDLVRAVHRTPSANDGRTTNY